MGLLIIVQGIGSVRFLWIVKKIVSNIGTSVNF